MIRRMHEGFSSKNPFVKGITIAAMVVIGVTFVSLLAIILGFVVMYLWNWIMPEIFGLPEIGYWMAVGMIILSRILFGGLGHGGHHGPRGGHPGHRDHMGRRGFAPWGHHHEFHGEHLDPHAFEEYWKTKGKEEFEEFLKNRE